MRLLLLLTAAAVAHAAPPTYSHDIEPIFSEHCSGCHLAKVAMGGLNLETWQGLMEGGSTGKAILPGDAQSSRLYKMITGKIAPAMPMNSTRLNTAQIALIAAWIDAGAEGPDAGAKPNTAATPRIPNIAPRAGLRPQIFDVAWSPDGKQLALAEFKKVVLLDASTRQPQAELTGPADTVRAVAFSRDGSQLAAAGGLPARAGEVLIWDARSGKLRATIRGHADCIFAIAFSPDGKTLATSSYDKLIKLWDTGSGAELRTFKDHIDAIYALAFTPDGKRLISGAADRTIKIWNVATSERLYTLSEPQDAINTVAIDPSGRFVAAAGVDKTIRVWELGPKSGRLVSTLIAHEDAILKLAWSPDGKRLLSSSADRTVKLFNASDLTELNTFPESDWVYGLAWSPDGKTFTAAGIDGTLEISQPHAGRSI